MKPWESPLVMFALVDLLLVPLVAVEGIILPAGLGTVLEILIGEATIFIPGIGAALLVSRRLKRRQART